VPILIFAATVGGNIVDDTSVVTGPGRYYLGDVLQTIPHTNPALVADPTGKFWRVVSISPVPFALVSLFVMGLFVAMACLPTTYPATKATD